MTENTGSDMTALSKNMKSSVTELTKLANAAHDHPLKPFRHLMVAVLMGLSGLSQAQASQQAAAPAEPASGAETILVVGDSLSAEYGLKRGTGWVPLLEKQLVTDNKSVKVINASISGDTTSGGRSRLPALLAQHKPSTVVIELGGNDALRGLPLDMTEKNLLVMTQTAKKSGAKVLLVGMQVPPNYGGQYGATFSGLYAKIAKAEKVALVPFFLKGIADVSDSVANFQTDRIHPNEQSQTRMLANVWPELKKLIQ